MFAKTGKLALFGALALLVLAGTAQGRQVHRYSYSGNKFDAGVGVEAIAVAQASHDVLVVSGTSVRKFTPAGNPVAFSGLGGATSFAPESGKQLVEPKIAVDNSGGVTDGNIYVATPNKLYGFAPSGVALEKFPVTVPNGNEACGLAVSPSGGIWLAFGEEKGIYREATLAGQFGSPLFVGIHNGGCQIDFDSSGNFYLTDGGRLVKLAPDRTELGEFFEGRPDLTFDRGEDMAFTVGSGEKPVGVLDSSGNPITSFGGPEPAHSYPGLSGSVSVAVDWQTHDVFAAHGNVVDVFSREASPITVPTVFTEAQSALAGTSATLNGSLDPEAVETTDCHFEWGTSAEYGNSAPCAQGSVFSGSGPNAVSAQISGLTKSQTYHFRLVSKNANEAPAFGRDMRFQAADPPLISSVHSRHITSDSVRIDTTIDPEGGATTFHVELGADTSYGTTVPIPDSAPNNLRNPLVILQGQEVGQEVAHLQPHTTYHYRVVATNPAGTTTGADHVFTTYSTPPLSGEDVCANAQARRQTGASTLLDCRGFELVSAVNTGGYDVRSGLDGTTPLATSSGAIGAALYSMSSGTIPGIAGRPTNRGADPYLARRGANGWSTRYVGLASDNPFASGPFASPLSGFDSALETFSFGGAEICSPCFEDGSTNLPVRLPDGSLVEGMSGSGGTEADPAGRVEAPLSPDGSKLIFATKAQLEASANSNGTDATIYERDLKGGPTEVISTDEGGATIQNGEGIAELGVSKDGSKVVIGRLISTDAENNRYYHLYLHLSGRQQSIDLTPGTTDGALYAGMSEDGSSVYFTTKDALSTSSEQDADSSTDLYRDQVEGASATLTRVSFGAGSVGNTDACAPAANSYTSHWNAIPGGPADCSVVAIGGGGGVASQSGVIYFLSPEKLDGGGVEGAPNLFKAAPGSGPQLVTTLESSASSPIKAGEHPFKAAYGHFSNPTGVAIDRSNGDSYVSDIGHGFGNSTISKFDSSGNPVVSYGTAGTLEGPGAIGAFGLPASIAVDNDPSSPSYRDLYVPGFLAGSVFKYDPSGNLISEFSVGGSPTSVAVDPANGHLYVGLAFFGVAIFDPTGSSLASFPTSTSPNGLAVDSNGTVYVTGGGGIGGEPKGVEVYDSSGAFLRTVGGNSTWGLAVDQGNDHLLLDEGSKVSEYDGTGAPVGVPIEGHFSGSRGLAADEGRAIVSDPAGEDVAEFAAALPLPDPAYDSQMAIDGVKAANSRHSEDFQVTPSGQDAAFPSSLPLTGVDSADRYELYRYDAGEGIACVSCSPTEAAPSGNATLAASGSSITDDGRVFFTTPEALVLRDSNERADAYEWEQGEQQLISTGTSEADSSLLSVSANGKDAFFFTRQKLVPQDENGANVRLYDAREGGGFEFGPPQFECAASDECHGASTTPAPPLSASTTAGTPGQFSEEKSARCAKGKVRRKGRCVKPRAKHHRAHKRAKHNRGGGK